MPKDACYYEAKEKYAVFPSGYASGYIAKCRKRKGIVNKSDKGYALKRWYAEDWRDEQGNICGSPTNENIKNMKASFYFVEQTAKEQSKCEIIENITLR